MSSAPNIRREETVLLPHKGVFNFGHPCSCLAYFVYVIDKVIRLGDTTTLRIALRRLALAHWVHLDTFNVRELSIAIETFQAEIRNKVSHLWTRVADPTSCTARKQKSNYCCSSNFTIQFNASRVVDHPPYFFEKSGATELNVIAKSSYEK